MRETSKTLKYSTDLSWDEWLKGRILDIGAGSDPIREECDVFDIQHGDANRITQFLDSKSYDTVYSSHCLEHMDDPKATLTEWWDILRPGGHMILIVPDNDLYEQHIWPSFFNDDHKWAFTIINKSLSHSRLLTISETIGHLPDATLITCAVQDDGLDYNFLTKDQSYSNRTGESIIRLVRLPFYRMGIIGMTMLQSIDKLLYKSIHRPIDQTLYGALAQIFLVLKKNS